jgi:hypothetical protein
MPSIASLPEYTTVLAQVFSPDGELYAAATLAGDLAVWRVRYCSTNHSGCVLAQP